MSSKGHGGSTPLLRAGESFNASGHWSSVNSAIQGDQPTSCTPKLLLLTS